MKKLIALALAGCMCFALTACGSEKLNVTEMTLPESVELTVGETAELKADFVFNQEEVNEEDAAKVVEALEKTFTSADEKIATVDENGVVTAVAEGETAITLTAGELTAETKVIVKAEEEEVPVEEALEENLDEKAEPVKEESKDKTTDVESTGATQNGGNNKPENKKPENKPSEPKPTQKPVEQPKEEQKPAPAPQPKPEAPAPAPQPQQPQQPAPEVPNCSICGSSGHTTDNHEAATGNDVPIGNIPGEPDSGVDNPPAVRPE